MDNHQIVISIILFLTFFYVKSEVIFDDYAGPYSFVRNHIGFDYCPIRGRPCANVTFNRRKLPNSLNWVFNATARCNIFMRKTTTIRVVAMTRGSSGRYQSLFDMTMPSCDWADFVKPLVEEIGRQIGYQYKCYAIIPGDYSMTNYVLDLERYKGFWQIPMAPYGFYRIEFRVSEQDNANCLCYRLFAKVDPDPTIIRQLQRNRSTKH